MEFANSSDCNRPIEAGRTVISTAETFYKKHDLFQGPLFSKSPVASFLRSRPPDVLHLKTPQLLQAYGTKDALVARTRPKTSGPDLSRTEVALLVMQRRAERTCFVVFLVGSDVIVVQEFLLQI